LWIAGAGQMQAIRVGIAAYKLVVRHVIFTHYF
jgi:hypothetical protein